MAAGRGGIAGLVLSRRETRDQRAAAAAARSARVGIGRVGGGVGAGASVGSEVVEENVAM